MTSPSDLIERLRIYRSVYDAELADEAADEIERLRHEIDVQCSSEYVERILKEIERLTEDRLCRCADEVRCELKAEIERLQKENWRMLDRINYQDAEIERLQAWKDEHSRTEGGECPYCEIDRLKEALK